MKKFKFVSRSFSESKGGIQYVANLIKKVIEKNPEIFKKGSFQLESLQDKTCVKKIRKHNNNKLSFLLSMILSLFNYQYFIFDQIGTSRTLAFLPFRKKIMSFFYGIEVWEHPFFAHLQAAKRNDLLVTISHYTKQRAIKNHGDIFKNAKVCLLGTNISNKPVNTALFSTDPSVLILSRLHKGRDKGHRTLIDIWPAVLKAVPNAILKIAGTGNDYESLKKYIEQSEAKNNIKLLGFVEDEMIEKTYLDSWVFAMPSLGEGFGLVYLDAMRWGLPVIASKNDAGQEINDDGVTGFNVCRNNDELLVQKIVYLLKNKTVCKNMGENGRKRWQENFTFEHFEKRFLKIVQEFLN